MADHAGYGILAGGSVASLSAFSGADLQVSFGKRIIGELQQISWAVQREKSPVFTLGSADARAVSRNKRGIGGSVVLAVFDRDALMEEIKMQWKDIAPERMFTAGGNMLYIEPNANQWGDNTPTAMRGRSFEDYLDMAGWNNSGNALANVEGAAGADQWSDGSAVASGKELYLPPGFELMHIENVVYIDQLPPIDVTLTFANEYGNAAFQKIYDMDFLNEGSGVSVDTIIMERRITWLARKLSPIMQGVFQGDAKYGNRDYTKTA